jgi:Xaa-Pro dipeptidase
MLAADIGALFMPHGLGHLLGIDTHDVGGYGPGLPLRSEKPGLKSLRLGRELEENMVITLEPGIYFIPSLLKTALADKKQSKFLVKAKLQKYYDFGGVRLEDDLVVTATGTRALTNVPRTVEDVEKVMAGGEWPPPAKAKAKDVA